jgi:hypothetical protein
VRRFATALLVFVPFVGAGQPPPSSSPAERGPEPAASVPDRRDSRRSIMLSQVVFVPPPPRPSAQAQELAAAIVRLAGEYQARNGKLNAVDLQAALRLADAGLQVDTGGAGGRQRAVVLIAVLGLLIAVGFSMYFIFSAER